MRRSSKNPLVSLEKIRIAIATIRGRTTNGKAFFLRDKTTQKSVRVHLARIGVAVANLQPGVKAIHREVDWERLGLLANAPYQDAAMTDATFLWRLVDDDLPRLSSAVRDLLRRFAARVRLPEGRGRQFKLKSL
jgi:uncharacterized protein with HEPN domain